ncbi:DM13 domain-containing protein [Algoriphagus antarcticus]|uniref:Electron transfer DM13 n=1 Tax=Algoriphagus antarcticus TaxID=238540 RepID=A0A3E0E1B0_9BACT|nr:DM13 domain-containing protein [Algoriphagus antarcticus]REG91430.1 electron transfer DM13 [Algoriphagus antarcticus]
MKNLFNLGLSLIVAVILTSCDSGSMADADKMKPVSEVPVTGPVTVLKTGTLTAQSSTNTKGMVQVVTNAEGKYFVRLTDEFTTKFSTGTVTVYLSTSDKLQLATSGSFQLVSIVGKAGEHFFPISGAPDAKFTHGIIWCGAAAIPFGFAPLN